LGLRDCQILAINKLEQSFKDAKPKALIQMATAPEKFYRNYFYLTVYLKFAKANAFCFW
jgi:type I restriction enzyme R subunit